MKVKGITLLSAEEYKEYRHKIKPVNDWWWLRSRGSCNYFATFVLGKTGDVYENGRVDLTFGVRPALIVECDGGEWIGETFEFGGKTWTLISGNLALADKLFCTRSFRKDWTAPDANIYDSSDVKEYLDFWLREHEEKPYEHTFCNRIILSGQDVCIVKDTCEGCEMNPERCAINDMLERQGTLGNWKDMDLPNFRERE